MTSFMPYTTLIDSAVYFLTLAGFFTVPDTTVPRPAWPLALGIWDLAIVGVRIARERTLPTNELGRLWAGALFATVGVALFVEPRRPLLALVISLGVAMGVGIIWSAWYAWKEGRDGDDAQRHD